MKVAFKHFVGDVWFGQYGTLENALQIFDGEELIATASVNLEAWGERRSTDNEVWIKCWSENEGIDKALVDAGVVESEFISVAWGGYNNSCRAVLAKLTPVAILVRDEQLLAASQGLKSNG